MLTDTISSPVSLPVSSSDRMKAALLALTLGAVLIFATGFAQPLLLHNAAHDSRHAAAFPCH